MTAPLDTPADDDTFPRCKAFGGEINYSWKCHNDATDSDGYCDFHRDYYTEHEQPAAARQR